MRCFDFLGRFFRQSSHIGREESILGRHSEQLLAEFSQGVLLHDESRNHYILTTENQNFTNIILFSSHQALSQHRTSVWGLIRQVRTRHLPHLPQGQELRFLLHLFVLSDHRGFLFLLLQTLGNITKSFKALSNDWEISFKVCQLEMLSFCHAVK